MNHQSRHYSATFSRRTLVLSLAALTCIGVTGCETGLPLPGGDLPSGPRLFVVGRETGEVESYANPRTLDGQLTSTTSIYGSAGDLDSQRGVCLNAAGELIVLVVNDNDNTGQISVFGNARSADRDVAAVRVVKGPSTQLSNEVVCLVYDKSRDHLYVVDKATNKILVFHAPGAAAFNGDIAPTRVISSTTGLYDPIAAAIDPADNRLYVADVGVIEVFEGASGLNGEVDPLGVIWSQVAVDNEGITGAFHGLYWHAASSSLFALGYSQYIYRYTDLTPQGYYNNVEPASVLSGGPAFQTSLTIDQAGTGYVVGGNNYIYAFDNIVGLDGDHEADRKFGSGFLVEGWGSFLDE